MLPSKRENGHVSMATLTSVWISLIGSALAYVPLDNHSLILLSAIAVLSYLLGYLCSQMQYPERATSEGKPPRKQRPARRFFYLASQQVI